MVRRLAGCIITNVHGRVLLIHRNTPRLSQWELPGGKVEENESAAQAATREALEEVNLVVEGLEEVGATEFGDNGYDWHYTWFRPSRVTGDLKLMEKTFDDIRFINILSGEVEDKVLSPNVVAIIKALKNKQFHL
ncbi:MAG TPA: NUDIX hydrolase [Candidatus Saccharimonadales bacterium]|nr:NUDIX hydrolase [Candidatus Saccharimonadales bacterium]